MDYSKFTMTDKGLQYKKDMSIKVMESEQYYPITSSSPKPIFLIKKAPASKLLLLSDGHQRFNNFQCQDIKKLSNSLSTSRLLTQKKDSPLIRVRTVKQNTRIFLMDSSINKGENMEINQNSPPNQIFFQNMINSNIKSQINLMTQKSLQKVLHLPSTIKSQRLEQKTIRHNYKFQNFKDIHVDMVKSMNKMVNDKLLDIQEAKQQPAHVARVFLSTLKSKDDDLTEYENLVQSHQKRQTERMKSLHNKTYVQKWGSMKFPGDFSSLHKDSKQLNGSLFFRRVPKENQ